MLTVQLAAADAINGCKLKWNPSTALDFSYYSVYTSQTSERDYQLLGDTPNPEFTVETLSGGTYYFVIYATDIHGNRSEASEELSITVI